MSIDRLPWLYDPESVRGWRVVKAALFIVFGGAFLVWYLFHMPESGSSIQERGTRIEGQVFRMGTLHNGKNLLSYGFRIDGKLISIQDRSVADFDGLKHMGPVEVWYDPSDPKRCTTEAEIRGESTRMRPIWVVLFLLLMLGLAGFQIYALFQPDPGKAILAD